MTPLKMPNGSPAHRATLLHQGYMFAGIILAIWLLAGCRTWESTEKPLFELLPPERTGITFVNALEEDPAFNIINYLYYYDGGGVSAGDVNNDGLPDIYLTSNLHENRLYLNKGDFVFEDITTSAGVTGDAGWTKASTMADVNGDGFLDLYVSVSNHLGKTGRNALFINNGDLTFTDQAAAYGLDLESYSSQATFFDYDLDGDLDLFQVNHSVHAEGTYGNISLRDERHPLAGDRLFRNDGGRFEDVSEAAGIIGGAIGYGLSAAVSDLNNDGCPDIYVANDFHENDYLYFNRCDGTFREAIYESTGHTSRSSMGSDIADFNNDGLTDIAVVDMLPEREDILKTAVSADHYDVDQLKLHAGYHHQYARNTLQLNRGNELFSEIGYLAGIEATDWSWSVLFCDLDLDGYKDLFVTNGIYRRPNDLDYLRYARQPDVYTRLQQAITEAHMEIIQHMPSVPLPNYTFRNEGDLTFSDATRAWGLDLPGFSNGAAYADLDNDGDLDLVVNNIESPAGVYENHARERPDAHYLTISLKGDEANTNGIGAKVTIRYDGLTQVQELMPTRGWSSSVEHRLHFGLGASTSIDTLMVIWPDRRFQIVSNLAADQHLVLDQHNAAGAYVDPEQKKPVLFVDVTEALGIDYRHQENQFFDFSREPLIPQMISREGPALAVGDANGDGLEDVFLGGAKWQAARLLLQQPDGRFLAAGESTWQADSLHEDVDAAFFDADGDGDLDLYVVSAGNEFWGRHEALRDRLYRNEGQGRFRRDYEALPEIFSNGSVVRPGDFDGDGDLDLFVGGRVVARSYGGIPPSYLLENDGKGIFRDATAELAEDLTTAGMITDAAWGDVDSDGGLDLIVVGEWTPLRVFVNRDNRLIDATEQAGLSRTNGWWTSVRLHDLDGDGDPDIVGGNLGANSLLSAGPDQPVQLHVKDFDNNGSLDPILTYYRKGERHLYASVDEILQQFNSLQGVFPSYAAFGDRSYEALFAEEQRAGARVEAAFGFETVVALNQGEAGFIVRPLPVEAQFAPVRSIVVQDINRDGVSDLILAGGFDGAPPRRGRYDASYGSVFVGDGFGNFEAVPFLEAGLQLRGDVRRVVSLTLGKGRRIFLVSRNNDVPLAFEESTENQSL